MNDSMQDLASRARIQTEEFSKAAAVVVKKLREAFEFVCATEPRMNVRVEGGTVGLVIKCKVGDRAVEIIKKHEYDEGWERVPFENASMLTKRRALALVPKLLEAIVSEHAREISAMNLAVTEVDQSMSVTAAKAEEAEAGG